MSAPPGLTLRKGLHGQAISTALQTGTQSFWAARQAKRLSPRRPAVVSGVAEAALCPHRGRCQSDHPTLLPLPPRCRRMWPWGPTRPLTWREGMTLPRNQRTETLEPHLRGHSNIPVLPDLSSVDPHTKFTRNDSRAQQATRDPARTCSREGTVPAVPGRGGHDTCGRQEPEGDADQLGLRFLRDYRAFCAKRHLGFFLSLPLTRPHPSSHSSTHDPGYQPSLPPHRLTWARRESRPWMAGRQGP